MYNSCANLIVNIQKNTANVRKVKVICEQRGVFMLMKIIRCLLVADNFAPNSFVWGKQITLMQLRAFMFIRNFAS